MSLINQMLKDLDRRRTQQSDSDVTLPGMQKTDRGSKRWLVYFVRGLIVLLIVLIVLVVTRPKLGTTSSLVKEVALPNTQQTLQHVSQGEQKREVNKDFLSEYVSEKVATADLTNFIHHTDGNISTLHFMLNRTTNYYIQSKFSHQELIINLNNTKLSYPIYFSSMNIPGLTSLQVKTKDNDLQLIFNLKPDTKINKILFNNHENSEMVVEIAHGSDVPAKAKIIKSLSLKNKKEEIEKSFLPPTPEELANEDYKKALNLIQKNDMATAITVLKQSLGKYSKFLPSIETLSMIYLQQGKLSKADKVLQIGLQQSPSSINLIKLKARVLITQDKYNKALSLLQKSAPAITDEPEYYALMAAIYDRIEQPNMAARLYKQLAVQQPNNGLWWMGLGMALEEMDRTNAALEAYQRATELSNLNPQSRAYVQGRIENIHG